MTKTVKYFKYYDDEFGEWHTRMLNFCPYKEFTRIPSHGGWDFKELSLEELTNQGYVEIDYYEFGAINNHCSVAEFKRRQKKAMADRLKNGD